MFINPIHYAIRNVHGYHPAMRKRKDAVFRLTWTSFTWDTMRRKITRYSKRFLIFYVILLWVMFYRFSGEKISPTPDESDHCIPGLPGCVPSTIEYVYFLHIPKAAGTTAGVFLNRGYSPEGFRPKPCHIPSYMAGHFFCYGKDSPAIANLETSPYYALGDIVEGCASERSAFRSAIREPIFAQQGCNIVHEGHYDFSMINALPLEILRRTLIVVAMRLPMDRVLSSFYYLRSYEPKNALEMDSVGLHRFAERGYGGEDTVNRMTKTLAGQYCCYNLDSTSGGDPDRLWELAVENFNKVGVVLIAEEMNDSLRYLADILGWKSAAVDRHLNPGSWRRPTDQHLLNILRNTTSLDSKLYDLGLQRLNQQKKVLRSGVLSD